MPCSSGNTTPTDETALLQLHDDAAIEVENLTNSEARIAELSKEVDKRLREMGKTARVLSEKRQVSAQKLATAVEQELVHLSMSGTRFVVEFETEPDENGVYVGEQRLDL